MPSAPASGAVTSVTKRKHQRQERMGVGEEVAAWISPLSSQCLKGISVCELTFMREVTDFQAQGFEGRGSGGVGILGSVQTIKPDCTLTR